MGFGTEGSLVLKNENRKRISNKEFQVFSLTESSQFLIANNTLQKLVQEAKESRKRKSVEARPQILGSNVTRCLLLLSSSLHIVLIFNFIRKLDITDIVQRLDIYKTGYLTHLVIVSDIFLYFIHFGFQEVKFASQILFRYFGIFNVSIGWLYILYRLVPRSESGWWRLASVKKTKLGKTLIIDHFTIKYLSNNKTTSSTQKSCH